MNPSLPKLCYITDRLSLDPRPLLPFIFEIIQAGIDLIQIREKDLGTRDLLQLARAVIEGRDRKSTRLNSSHSR